MQPGPTILLTLAALLTAAPAVAQLGTAPNPPPQKLFDLGQPPRLDTGTGAMANPRAQATPSRRAVPRHRLHHAPRRQPATP